MKQPPPQQSAAVFLTHFSQRCLFFISLLVCKSCCARPPLLMCETVPSEFFFPPLNTSLTGKPLILGMCDKSHPRPRSSSRPAPSPGPERRNQMRRPSRGTRRSAAALGWRQFIISTVQVAVDAVFIQLVYFLPARRRAAEASECSSL